MVVLRNTAALILGIAIGSFVNMGIVMGGSAIIPPPAGVDPTNPDSIAASMHLFEARHFLTPFLAHAVGTLVGAMTAWFVAVTHKDRFAWAVGVLFLAGGIYASTLFPAPTWFIAADILLAYLPMAWLGMTLARRIQGKDAAGEG